MTALSKWHELLELSSRVGQGAHRHLARGLNYLVHYTKDGFPRGLAADQILLAPVAGPPETCRRSHRLLQTMKLDEPAVKLKTVAAGL